MAGALVLLVLVSALAVCPASAQGLDPFTGLVNKGQTTVLGISKPALTIGIVVVGLMGLFGMTQVGASIGRILVCGTMIVGAAALVAWL